MHLWDFPPVQPSERTYKAAQHKANWASALGAHCSGCFASGRTKRISHKHSLAAWAEQERIKNPKRRTHEQASEMIT